VLFLRYKDTGKVHAVMRREKTHKVCMNHMGRLFMSIHYYFFMTNCSFSNDFFKFIFFQHTNNKSNLFFAYLDGNIVTSSIKLEPNSGSDKSWVWTVPDFSDSELSSEVFAIKFKSKEGLWRSFHFPFHPL
jgi:hypothetical protein